MIIKKINNDYNKNINKQKQPSKKNVFLESGQNIVYGSKSFDTKNSNKNINEDGGDEYGEELKDSNYDDYDINENDNNLSKNKTKNSKNISKLTKLNNASTPYERLEILKKLELENKKKDSRAYR